MIIYREGYQEFSTKVHRDISGEINFYYSITREFVSRGSMLLYMILLLSIGVVGDILSNAVQALFS